MQINKCFCTARRQEELPTFGLICARAGEKNRMLLFPAVF